MKIDALIFVLARVPSSPVSLEPPRPSMPISTPRTALCCVSSTCTSTNPRSAKDGRPREIHTSRREVHHLVFMNTFGRPRRNDRSIRPHASGTKANNHQHGSDHSMTDGQTLSDSCDLLHQLLHRASTQTQFCRDMPNGAPLLPQFAQSLYRDWVVLDLWPTTNPSLSLGSL